MGKQTAGGWREQAAADIPPRLEVRGITKRYPGGMLANDGVSLRVMPGEIHALLGENGAGKSTLVKIIYGVLQPDAGEIRIDGHRVRIDSPHTARRLGIAMVFQHFALFEGLNLIENIALGLEEPPPRRELTRRIAEISHTYGLPLHPERPVHALSVGERQRIELIRALLQQPKLLIMDEPTSVLTPQESARLFALLRQLAAGGCAVLYISHRLAEVAALCERATILREGRVVATVDPRTTAAREMARLMVGRDLPPPRRRAARPQRAPVLEVDGLSAEPTSPFGVHLADVRFAVEPGEIFGIGGVAGNGQQELFVFLSGERVLADGAVIRLAGQPIGHCRAAARRRLGLCALPEERHAHAAVDALSLTENALLTAWWRPDLTRLGLISWRQARAFANQIIKRFDVRGGDVHTPAWRLSGGNLQKFVVGREILQQPRVLVVAQPTWGLDAGAAAAIREALSELAARAVAIVLISQDLDELLALSDRLAILNGGRLSPPLATAEADIEQLGLLMGGLHDLGEPQFAHAFGH